jgi:hypothetical protein
MPHSNDEPRDLASRLRKFNLFENTPIEQIEARDPVKGAIQPPGSLEMPHGRQAPGVLGWDDIFKKNKICCRWCGTEMYFYEENDKEILYACPYPGCRNNPNTPENIRLRGLKATTTKSREKQF